MEILIALIIASVVMLMAAYGFQTVTSMSVKVREGLSTSESAYFILGDLERRFAIGRDIRHRFNELQLDGAVYDFGVEYTTRQQESRRDTFPNHFTAPTFGARQKGMPMDSVSLIFNGSRITWKRFGSLADHVNKQIFDGQD